MLDTIRRRMGERFSNVWVLLTDTDRFVSRAGLMKDHERQLRIWRSKLGASQSNMEVQKEVREEIIAFRRQMRNVGWELRLGSLDIQLKGFRSDNAMAVGFRRMVLMIGDDNTIKYISGDANHIELDEELSISTRKDQNNVSLESHYLWYRRTEGVLELSGSDSEHPESFKKLADFVKNNKSILVKHLHKLN